MIESKKQNPPIYDAHCHFSLNPPSVEEFQRFCQVERLRGFFLGGFSPEEWVEQRILAKAHPSLIHS